MEISEVKKRVGLEKDGKLAPDSSLHKVALMDSGLSLSHPRFDTEAERARRWSCYMIRRVYALRCDFFSAPGIYGPIVAKWVELASAYAKKYSLYTLETELSLLQDDVLNFSRSVPFPESHNVVC